MYIADTTSGKPVAPADRHLAKIINIMGDKLVTKSDGCGQQVYTLAKDVHVTRDGRLCRVEDLRLGSIVRITTRKDDESMAIEIDCGPCA